MESREITCDNAINAYMHCQRCLQQIPAGISPREWAQLEIGFTPIGLQVWCRRHEMKVMHVDFEGAKHPAATNGLPKTA